MTLNEVSFYGEDGHHHISIEAGKIRAVSNIPFATDSVHLDLDGALCIPGLINSHDHLDFNLFPSLGNRTYSSYTEWGPHIRETYPDIISEIQGVPLKTRVDWGIYKNLLNGFTTVVNHGAKLEIENSPVDVHQENQSLHSPAFEKEWKWKINNPLRIRQPVVMHVGEGIDEHAATEVGQVMRSNRLGRQLVGVHGVAMDAEQADKFYGLVWCPASNYFLLGKTADTGLLRKHTHVVFGTDSTLTSPWNCWEHFRLALKPGDINEQALLEMLTIIPAKLWGMNDRGKIQPGKKADLIILKNKAPLFSMDPSDILLVIQAGVIRVADESVRLPDSVIKAGLTRINISGSQKWVQGDLQGMLDVIKKYYPSFQSPFSHAW